MLFSIVFIHVYSVSYKCCSVLFLFMCIVVSPVTPPPLVFSLVYTFLFIHGYMYIGFLGLDFFVLCSRRLLFCLLSLYLKASDYLAYDLCLF